MAIKRPEAMSPSYFSFASPDIPGSDVFRWAHQGTNQTKFKIVLYKAVPNDNSGTPVEDFVFESTSSDSFVSFEDTMYTFESGQIYHWEVTTWDGDEMSGVSSRAKFLYDAYPGEQSITWSPTPLEGQMVSADYLLELRDNISSLLNGYDNITNSLQSRVSKLFSGNVVPSKKDFTTLEEALMAIGENEGITYNKFKEKIEEIRPYNQTRKWDVYNPLPVFDVLNVEESEKDADELSVMTWVGDGLGASDIEKIKAYIQMLTSIPPKNVRDVDIQVSDIVLHTPSNIQVSSDGLQDRTIDVTWDVVAPTYWNTKGEIYFNELSPSPDVRFYECDFSYTHEDGTFTSRLYFRPEDLEIETTRRFDTNWDGLYTSGEATNALHAVTMRAIDNRGNQSGEYNITKTYGQNFLVPLGVDYYEIEVQRTSLSASTYDEDGVWHHKYKGTSKSATYALTGGEGKIWHRIRAVDLSGLTSDWVYGPSITFDPLDPPQTPSSVHTKDIKTDSITIAWSATTLAESYRVKQGNAVIYEGAATSFIHTGLSSNTTYNYTVSAINTAGESGAVQTSGKTLAVVTTKTWDSTTGRSWRQWGWRSYKAVYQGQWCENGTCYGKHKGVWFFDWNSIKSELQGKTIKKVRMLVDRERGGYHAARTPTFWLHNYASVPSGEPTLSNSYKNDDFAIPILTSGWVELPASYAEHMRDGKAKGIGIFDADYKPYMIFTKHAKLEITYEG